jgi:hypothetical protein
VDDVDSDDVRVQVVRLSDGREIAWGDGLTEQLHKRLRDIHKAIDEGVRAVASGLSTLSVADGWSVDEIAASFGITLAAEAGVLLSKASSEATFEVTVTLRRAA